MKLVNAHGMGAPFLITAIALATFGVLAALVLRDAPGRALPSEPMVRRLRATMQLRITWQASALYAIGFGGYVAFSVYLPTYLKNAYGPVGGWLSDRFGPIPVLTTAFGVVAVTALAQSPAPDLAPVGTIAFLVMAGALGAASGAVFALVAQRAPANKVGAVAGVVGAAGGLGGFIPPLIMGGLYDGLGSYTIGMIALAAVAALVLVLTATVVSKDAASPH